MSENVIFCYSGTGNCLDMAKTIARELGDTDIILMRKEPAVTDVRDAKRVGFVFPCYGGGLPGGVEESLCKIQVGLTAYTFGVCQYAGYMGSGLYKLNSIIPLRYWTAVSHQCTCIWLLPHSVMLPPVTPAMAQRRADKKAKQIAHAEGLGTVWVNREREIFDSPDGKALLRDWGLPETLRGVGAIALGYAAGPAPEAAPRKENYIVHV